MSNINSRLAKLEKKMNPVQVVYDVQEVDEITDEMRQAQREAHARGEAYYIIEEDDNEQY